MTPLLFRHLGTQQELQSPLKLGSNPQKHPDGEIQRYLTILVTCVNVWLRASIKANTGYIG